ncbi:MAG TPA: response regulator [Thermoanaerobaculia bacterium]|nr:response regulator [Thermoanaerobaculia bacterium]
MQPSARTKVLVVEDQPATRSALEELLVGNGFEVAVASDGLQALEVARAFRPTVVLMDFELPAMNGWEASLRLRRDPQTANTWILAVTGHDSPEARVLAREVGCLEVIEKPVDPRRLVARLRELGDGPLDVEALPEPVEEGR